MKIKPLALTATLLLTVACSPPLPELPRQQEALDHLWYEVLEVKARSPKHVNRPPSVDWFFQDRLDCDPDVNGRAQGWTIETHWDIRGTYTKEKKPLCVEGLTYTSVEVQVAYMEGQKLSATALAHELVHAARLSMGLPPDPDHLDPQFAVDEARAVAALKAMGL